MFFYSLRNALASDYKKARRYSACVLHGRTAGRSSRQRLSLRVLQPQLHALATTWVACNQPPSARDSTLCMHRPLQLTPSPKAGVAVLVRADASQSVILIQSVMTLSAISLFFFKVL
jgi:hypothetical protein